MDDPRLRSSPGAAVHSLRLHFITLRDFLAVRSPFPPPRLTWNGNPCKHDFISARQYMFFKCITFAQENP